MNIEKAPRIKVIFYGLLVSTGITALVLLLDVNNLATRLLTTSVIEPLPKRLNDIQDTQSRLRHFPNVFVNNSVCNILIFNPPHWVSVEKIDVCDFSNCRVTSNRSRSNLQSYSAIIFYTTVRLPLKPPISPSNRNPNQVWIFAWHEAPVRQMQNSNWRIYLNKHWRNTVNWTMTYTHDADVFYGYGTMRKRIPPVKNYSEIFHRKSKMAAWVVSNCHTPSQRDKYVKKLQQYGVKIDIFGKCAGKRIDSDKVRSKIELNYMFYLSFENSICKDYITEKFFKYLQYDVVLVTRGGGNYSSLLPNDSYINTADFGHIKDLAKHSLTVGSSEKRYSKYLENKDKFESVPVTKSFCHVCEKLNHLEENRRTYADLVKTVHHNTCFKPTDIN